jgi:quercetin dioxygenase-like cupin family protein
MENTEVEIGKAFIVVEIIEYVPNSVISKTILEKTTGKVTAVSYDSSQALIEKIIPFDTFIQIIDGKAEIVIDRISNFLETGNSIIIPAHTSNSIRPNQHFKMISTVIKSGYE